MDFTLMGTAAGLLVAMEIGDKTQLVIISLTASTRRAIPIFLGAAAAFALLTLLAVALGTVVTELLPPGWLARASGIAFLVLGVFLLWGSRSLVNQHAIRNAVVRKIGSGSMQIALGVFALLLVAEMGDKSQLSLIALTARTGRPVEVFLGGAAGLVTLTLVTILAGNAVARHVPQALLTRAAAVVFIVVGLVTIWTTG